MSDDREMPSWVDAAKPVAPADSGSAVQPSRGLMSFVRDVGRFVRLAEVQGTRLVDVLDRWATAAERQADAMERQATAMEKEREP